MTTFAESSKMGTDNQPVKGGVEVDAAQPQARPLELNSALTYAKWEQLEHDVFDGAPEAIQRVRDYARSNFMSPIAMVILCAQWALTSLPGTATFNVGIGDGSPNLFVALVGAPGTGKDSHIGATRRGMRVFKGVEQVEPRQLSFGSGEGLVTALKPGKEETMSAPVLFGTGEVSTLSTLMERTSSTLRSHILDMYSGNPLGFTNKAETVSVKANSYTAGLWVGVQPDKAGMLLEGEDDGLKHRFVWTELLDPMGTDYPGEKAHECAHVFIPQNLADGTGGFTFDDSIVKETQAHARAVRRTGHTGKASGHRNQTRAKLACGLALLSSRALVTIDDWERAGHLMDYSDKIQAYCLQHLTNREVEEYARKLEQKEDAETQFEGTRIARSRNKIMDSLKRDARVQWAGSSGLLQSVNSRSRGALSVALEQLVNEGKVSKIEIAKKEGEAPVTDAVERGSNYGS